MLIENQKRRTIWTDAEKVAVIDQRALPFKVVIEQLGTSQEMVTAIRDMHVRGAPLIGVSGAYGVYLGALELSRHFSQRNNESDLKFNALLKDLEEARPTAVNLRWAVEHQRKCVANLGNWTEIADRLLKEAEVLAEEDIRTCKTIGDFGLEIIKRLASKKRDKSPINILTHCNAGWLCAVDYGTATAPMYRAFEEGIPIHVWVDETRPRLQGAKLTAFELGQQGIPHTVIADNAGGHLMQHGQVDLCIVGTDRTTRCGDVANKIGTYLKALAAKHNNVPFYVAAPSSSIDWTLREGRDIPIENRTEDEVLSADGIDAKGVLHQVRIAAPNSPAFNPGFDVTPRELITGIITERGNAQASEESLISFFPEYK